VLDDVPIYIEAGDPPRTNPGADSSTKALQGESPETQVIIILGGHYNTKMKLMAREYGSPRTSTATKQDTS